VHHMHNVTESSGRIGECSDGLMGGDIDGCGGRVEPAACKGFRGGRGGVLVDVAQQDRLVYADPGAIA
jgi:hypothetical protein